MIKNYFIVAARNLRKNRLISFINIFGIGLSMSIGMMVMIRLQDQLDYDTFHPYPQSTYRILTDFRSKSGEHWEMASTPLPLHDKLADFAGVENSVNIYPALGGKATAAGKELYINGAFTEPSFFDIFGFSLAAGNPATALAQPASMVISQRTAERFFGKEPALGQTIAMESGAQFIVTGVLYDAPTKSHINFDAFAAMNTVTQLEKDEILTQQSSNWYAINAAYTYVVIKSGYSPQALSSDLKSVSDNLNKSNKEGRVAFEFQPITEITPGKDFLHNEIGRGGSWTKLYVEIGITLLILLAAVFNYVNLTIARAVTRAKEVGIRKISGANRVQVFVQYMVESMLIALISLGFAWLLLSFIIKTAPFNDDYEFIPASFQYNAALVGWSVAFALFTGMLAGTAPALILSSFKPLQTLKNLVTVKIVNKVGIQKILIVFQYGLSLILVIFLLTFYRQFSHMAAADPGFKRSYVLTVPLNGLDEKVASQRVMEISGVRSVGTMSSMLKKRFDGLTFPVWLSSKQEAKPLNYYYADAAFIHDMKLEFVAGGNFHASSPSSDERYLVVNEQAVKGLGFKIPSNAVGQEIWINDTTKLEIVGVLKDFNYESMGRPIMPLAFRNRKSAYNYLYITVDNTDTRDLTKRIAQSLADLSPSQSFPVSWLDEQLAANNSQAATISLLGYLAFMAIAIATLGLLGLVIYTVETKRKEIGIRKVVGASHQQLIRLLSRGFIKLLFVSGFIAVPIGYIVGYLFLQGFPDRVGFNIWSVLPCFVMLLVVGLFTIVSQTHRAAIANPVDSLRDE